MARGAGTVVVKIAGDASKFQSELGKVEGKLGKFGKLAGAAVAGVGAAAAGAAVGLFKIGQSFDAQVDKIRVGTGATGETLKGLEDDFKAIASTAPASFDDVGTAVADLNTRLGLAGEPLRELSAQFLDLSRLTGTDLSQNIADITRVFGDWGVTAEDQADALDQIYRASQATGSGVNELAARVVQFGAPLRQMGFGFTESIALLGKFEKEGVNTELVMGSLRIALGKLAREGKEPVQAFQEQVQAIKDAGDAGEANAKALELFGARAGPDMAAAIREGRLELGELFEQVASGEDTIGKAAADTEDFAQKWQRLKNRVLIGLQPLAEKVFDGMGRAMDAVVPVVEKVAEAFKFLFGEGDPQGFAEIMDSAFGNSGRLVKHFRTFGEVVLNTARTLSSAFRTAQRVVAEVVGFISGLFSSSGDDVGSTGSRMQSTLSQVAETFRSTFAAIQQVVSTVVSVVSDLWARFGDTLLQKMQTAWNNIMQIVGGALQALQGVMQLVTGILQGDWSKAWEGIKNVFGGVWNAILGIGKQLMNLLSAVISGGMALISMLWSRAWDGIKDAARSVVGDIVGFFAGLPGRISALAGALLNAGLALGRAIKDGIVGGIKGTVGALGDIAGQMWQAIKSVINSGIQAINDLIPNKINVPGPIPDINLPDNPIPRLHTGGVYRAPHGQQEGLALLRDREMVLTPDQYPAIGGPSIGQIVVNGYQASPGEIVDEVWWRMRTAGV